MAIRDNIKTAISTKYQPAEESQPEGVEYLSTIELMAQFEAVADVDKNDMSQILSELGFTIAFVFDEYKWALGTVHPHE